ncbi:nuclease-related domain-containing protein [Alkalibacillus haloalkaliphilus]|uniref:nuclease-related domain-containing protein n=1 Tax=Alkalibacillus haloalkaliphilus TaxID=94136 RepID=UPI002935C891|nr:nuclease-related domain-containing protein [Alkalibacillus haloalkaliphilus]MDV2582800.1 nuclease-related domain-containing protein [Alkalibacillus haloalkaliphilus]
MIVKEHEIPAKLLKLAAAHKRLFEHHPDYRQVESELYRERSGYAGELRVDYPLSKLDFPHFILHDLRLRLFQNYFQMDTLLLTERFGLILEVKNFTGIISINPTFNQLIQTVDGETHTYNDPVIQVEEQKQQQLQWLGFSSIHRLPIEILVVMANPKATLDITSEKHRDHIIPISQLTQKIRDISQKYHEPVMPVDATSRLAHKMKDHHNFKNYNIENNFRIHFDDYKRGIFCPNCKTSIMIRLRRRWQCRRCKFRSHDAHENAFKDFYLLKGDEITNREVRDFLRVESASLSKHFLKSAGYKTIGKTNTRKYLLDYDYQEDFSYLLH